MLEGHLSEPRAKLTLPSDQQAHDAVRVQRRLKIVRLAKDRRNAARHFLRQCAPAPASQGQKTVKKRNLRECFRPGYAISAEGSLSTPAYSPSLHRCAMGSHFR